MYTHKKLFFCQAKSTKNIILGEGNCSHSAPWDHSLASPRSVTSCGQQHIQQKGSGQNNHRQISSRLTQPGWTSRFFQDSIRAWIMTGSAVTRSYLDHCGARVIEFKGRRERWWNGGTASHCHCGGSGGSGRIVSGKQPLWTDLLHVCREATAPTQQRPL